MDSWTPPDDLLKNRVVLITGAGNGIGRALSLASAGLGATVVLLDKHIPVLETLYDDIENSGGPQPAIYPMNLEGATLKDYNDLANTLDQEFGRLDGLVHNAAELGTLAPLAHHDVEQWYKTLQVNLTAPFLLTQSCLNLLCQAPDASVLFLSDQTGRQGKAYWGAYAAAKAGLENFMQVLADEMETNTPLRANSYDPGPVRTRLRRIAYPGEDSGKLAPPEAVITPCLYLLSEQAVHLTGGQYDRTHLPWQG